MPFNGDLMVDLYIVQVLRLRVLHFQSQTTRFCMDEEMYERIPSSMAVGLRDVHMVQIAIVVVMPKIRKCREDC